MNADGRVRRSYELYRRAEELIPGGTQLISRRPTRYDPETEVLTQQGFRRFPELQGDEVLATLNQVTGELEWQAIQRLIVQDFDGQLIHFRNGTRLDLLVTPDHKVYREYEDRQGRKEFRLESAQDTVRRKKASPIRMTAAVKWQGCHQTDICTAPVPHKRWKSKGITRFPAASFMRFLGYYLTEGCLVRKP